MKRTLKWLAIIAGAVVVLIVGAAILLPLVVDPNEYKPALVAQVKKHTGRDLRIDGDIELSVFPWIGVELGKTALSNAPGFPEQFFASTEQVAIRVKLLPLLAKRIEVGTVTIRGLDLNLARNAAGRTNWDDLVAQAGQGSKGGGTGGSGSAPPSPDSGGSAGAPALALAIGGLDIRDANLSWDDARSGRHYEIQNFSASTGGLSAGEPVAFEVAMDLEAVEPPVSGHVDAEGRVHYDAASKRARIEGLEIAGAFSGESLPGGEASFALAASVEHDGDKQTLHVAGLEVEVEDLALSGDVRVTGLDSAPSANGSLRIAPFNPKELLAALGDTSIETADPEALTRASLEATFGGKPNALVVKPLTIQLDESTLSGELSLPDLASQALRFDLSVDAIDADRYMPPQKDKDGGSGGSSATVATTPGSAAGGASKPPNEALRKLDVIGRMRIGKLKAAKLNMTGVDVSLKAKDGVIRLDPIGASLYEGTYRGNIVVDARGDVPRTEVDENLIDVLVGPLLADLQGKDHITGRANINLAMRATGASADMAKKTLNGSANFAFTDGAIKGVNVARMIREGYARIKGRKLPPDEAVQQTDFSEMRGTMRIENGVASNDDFVVMTPLLRINGKGTVNLPEETVDYRVKATVVQSLEGQGGESIDELVGVPVPIRVTGRFAEPRYALDVQALAEELAKDQVKEKLTETIDKKIGDDKVKGLLKGLIK